MLNRVLVSGVAREAEGDEIGKMGYPREPLLAVADRASEAKVERGPQVLDGAAAAAENDAGAERDDTRARGLLVHAGHLFDLAHELRERVGCERRVFGGRRVQLIRLCVGHRRCGRVRADAVHHYECVGRRARAIDGLAQRT